MNESDAPFTLTVVAGIVIYAFFEYQRREQAHKEAMEYLRRDLLPPVISTAPKLWQLVTTGLVCYALLVVSSGFAYLALKRPGGGMLLPFLSLGTIFIVLFVMSLGLLVGDIRAYRSASRLKRGGIQ